jgi:hypothetical protein
MTSDRYALDTPVIFEHGRPREDQTLRNRKEMQQRLCHAKNVRNAVLSPRLRSSQLALLSAFVRGHCPRSLTAAASRELALKMAPVSSPRINGSPSHAPVARLNAGTLNERDDDCEQHVQQPQGDEGYPAHALPSKH